MNENTQPTDARFVPVAMLDGLRPGAPLRVIIEGHTLVLARHGDAVYAFQATCPHEKADLTQARIEHGCLVCPRHLAAFALTDGKASAGWHNVEPLKLYPVRIVTGAVEVDAAAVARRPPGGKRQVWDFSS